MANIIVTYSEKGITKVLKFKKSVYYIYGAELVPFPKEIKHLQNDIIDFENKNEHEVKTLLSNLTELENALLNPKSAWIHSLMLITMGLIMGMLICYSLLK